MPAETITLCIDPGFRALLPVASPEQLTLLESDIRSRGCRDPLVVWESEESAAPILIDGHNRYEICTRLNLPCKTVVLQGCPTRADVLLWIVANQLARRNLTQSQKAAVSVELEKQLAAEAKKRQRLNNASKATLPYSEKGQARDQAAEMFGASPRYVQDAKKIEHDAPEILEQVKQGNLSIPKALQVAALPVEDRPAALERFHTKEPVEEGGYIYRDGQLVAVQTNKEVAVWLQQTSQVLDAIKALATVEVSPEDYLRVFPPESAYRVEAHLAAATQWLKQFVMCWEARI